MTHFICLKDELHIDEGVFKSLPIDAREMQK